LNDERVNLISYKARYGIYQRFFLGFFLQKLKKKFTHLVWILIAQRHLDVGHKEFLRSNAKLFDASRAVENPK